MLRIKLGSRRYLGEGESADLFLPRRLAGWDPTMDEQEVYDAARGWWRLSERAERENYAVVVGDDAVRMVIAIDQWQLSGDGERRAFSGRILRAGHAVHDKFVDQGDPVVTGSRNPVAYFEDDADLSPCLCGCGTPTRNEWAPGHDQIAIHRVIKANFGGSVREFIDFCRKQGLALA